MTAPSRAQLEEFLTDLASPIGPEVFAGIGTELQTKRYRWQNEESDIVKGVAPEQEQLGELIRSWASNQDTEETLDLLFDIACDPPDERLHNNIYQRRRQDWDHFLTILIYELGIRNRPLLLSKLEAYARTDQAASIIGDVYQYLDGK